MKAVLEIMHAEPHRQWTILELVDRLPAELIGQERQNAVIILRDQLQKHPEIALAYKGKAFLASLRLEQRPAPTEGCTPTQHRYTEAMSKNKIFCIKCGDIKDL